MPQACRTHAAPRQKAERFTRAIEVLYLYEIAKLDYPGIEIGYGMVMSGMSIITQLVYILVPVLLM